MNTFLNVSEREILHTIVKRKNMFWGLSTLDSDSILDKSNCFVPRKCYRIIGSNKSKIPSLPQALTKWQL